MTSVKRKNRNQLGMVHGHVHLFRVLHSAARSSSGSTTTAKINSQRRLTMVYYMMFSPLFKYHILNISS